jgi:hypothetical protein
MYTTQAFFLLFPTLFLTFVGKNNPHSKVLSGFEVGQIKYEAKFNPVKGAIYAYMI